MQNVSVLCIYWSHVEISLGGKNRMLSEVVIVFITANKNKISRQVGAEESSFLLYAMILHSRKMTLMLFTDTTYSVKGRSLVLVHHHSPLFLLQVRKEEALNGASTLCGDLVHVFCSKASENGNQSLGSSFISLVMSF